VGTDDVAENMGTGESRNSGRPTGLLIWVVIWVGGSLLAFAVLDPILAAAAVIVGATALVMAHLARDWDDHSTFEEREQARAERRRAKWAANQAARDRDRARWEAHQARQAKKAGE
jgi:hypothetical protein